jgi:histidinol-phosphate phosphatase family protein
LDWKQFIFLPGVKEAFKIFSQIFGKIIVVTNQQGIGKGLMTEDKLVELHSKMKSEILKSGGRLDAVYFAPQLKEFNHIDRKPNVGMALKSKRDFPEIDFKKAIMAGDSKSDMEFGHRLGMLRVLVNTDKSVAQSVPELVNFVFDDLASFSAQLKNVI